MGYPDAGEVTIDVAAGPAGGGRFDVPRSVSQPSLSGAVVSGSEVRPAGPDTGQGAIYWPYSAY